MTAWIRSPINLCDEIIYPFPYLNGCTVEVWNEYAISRLHPTIQWMYRYHAGLIHVDEMGPGALMLNTIEESATVLSLTMQILRMIKVPLK